MNIYKKVDVIVEKAPDRACKVYVKGEEEIDFDNYEELAQLTLRRAPDPMPEWVRQSLLNLAQRNGVHIEYDGSGDRPTVCMYFAAGQSSHWLEQLCDISGAMCEHLGGHRYAVNWYA